MLRTTLALVLLAAVPAAQLADLQPGRNFVKVPQFGLDLSDDIGAGDVDGDGDLDVVVANGSWKAGINRIFINSGGAQGGSAGAFVEETSARFAGFPADASRDVEFTDIESDGDLDLFIANNTGNTSTGGEPSRFYVNSGGLQGGAIGFFTEGTDGAWGQLVSVPLEDQVLGGNVGPFRGYSCDCDFADFDDDGDEDLFWSTYGPALAGTRDSRIFLNDGGGVFDELWPWADPAADTRMHATDVDLADFDGDFDLDVVVSSRNSQARVFANNLYGPLGSTPFTDITQAALVDTGATYKFALNYEVEYADVDGDGDFDLWMDSYGTSGSNQDALLRNEGPLPEGGFAFSMPALIKQAPETSDSYQSFVDYDNDGDLDALSATFSGVDFLYTSSLAQGLDPDVDGLFHRNNETGSLAPWPELPTLTSATSRDSSAADLDEDGDEDLLVANDLGQQNFLYLNDLGVPDTHAPGIAALTHAADAPAGSPTTIHAAVRDNSAWFVVDGYDVRLVWSVGGGAETSQPMGPQGGQQFRGVIPDLGDATVSYHVEVTDRAGNTGVSETMTYVQGAGSGPWTDLRGGLAGADGIPQLAGTGSLVGGSPGTLSLSAAAPSAGSLLLLALGSSPVPFKGGTLGAWPTVAQVPLVTDGTGGWILGWAEWPSVPAGTQLWFQVIVQDAQAVQGFSIGNLLKAVAP